MIPDVVWISKERRSHLVDTAGHLTGAPELVVEVLSNSPKDKQRDQETKLELYSVQGVTEYWIADREQRLIAVYRQEQGRLQLTQTLWEGDRLTSPLLPGFSCEVSSLFEG